MNQTMVPDQGCRGWMLGVGKATKALSALTLLETREAWSLVTIMPESMMGELVGGSFGFGVEGAFLDSFRRAGLHKNLRG